jgi:hypothetical protein
MLKSKTQLVVAEFQWNRYCIDLLERGYRCSLLRSSHRRRKDVDENIAARPVDCLDRLFQFLDGLLTRT